MVPTGMKMGVWMSPWSVVSTPARAGTRVLGFESELQRVVVHDRTLQAGTPKVTSQHGRHTLQHSPWRLALLPALRWVPMVFGIEGQDVRGAGLVHFGHWEHDGLRDGPTHRPLPRAGLRTLAGCQTSSASSSTHPTEGRRHGGHSFVEAMILFYLGSMTLVGCMETAFSTSPTFVHQRHHGPHLQRLPRAHPQAWRALVGRGRPRVPGG